MAFGVAYTCTHIPQKGEGKVAVNLRHRKFSKNAISYLNENVGGSAEMAKKKARIGRFMYPNLPPSSRIHFSLQLWVHVLLIIYFLKLINNSSSLNKGNHDLDGVWISDLNWQQFLWFCFSIFSLVLVLIEKIYQTLKTVFDHISKHLKVCEKYSAIRCIFNFFSVFQNVVKHGLFLVWYITTKSLQLNYWLVVPGMFCVLVLVWEKSWLLWHIFSSPTLTKSSKAYYRKLLMAWWCQIHRLWYGYHGRCHVWCMLCWWLLR